MMNRVPERLLSILVSAVLLSGCVVSRDPISGKKGTYGYSWAEEVKLGAEADGQIGAQYGTYDNEALSAYVDSLGQSLVAVSHLRREGAEPEWKATQFHFRVLDTPVVNAFALPGGYVYVTRGLLAHVENEAQLAVVMGHEIGHVAARHTSKRARNQMFSNVALIAGAIGGQVLAGGRTAENVLNYGGKGTQLLLLSYSRGDETQADELGVEYASLTGYRAAEGSGFFRSLKRLSVQSGQDIPSFMQTHPDPGQRETHIQSEARKWSADTSKGHVRKAWYLNHIDGLVYGENPRQGIVRGEQFVHPDLAFQFDIPTDFRVSNQPTQVILSSKDGRASARMSMDTEHSTGEQAAKAFAIQKGITVTKQGTASFFGIPSHYILADAKADKVGDVRLRVHFMDYNGGVFSFLAFTKSSDFKAYDSILAPMIKSFRPLLDSTVLAIQPDRIEIEHADRKTDFQSLIKGRISTSVSANTLAILNQKELMDSVARGEPYKLVH